MEKIQEKWFEITYEKKEGYFHRILKPKIIKYANANIDDMYLVGNNPDVLWDKNKYLYLTSATCKGKCIKLNKKIDYFLETL